MAIADTAGCPADQSPRAMSSTRLAIGATSRARVSTSAAGSRTTDSSMMNSATSPPSLLTRSATARPDSPESADSTR